ncbi:hypothetical protein JMJ77_0009165, partial [Colletotrichum scovillei]
YFIYQFLWKTAQNAAIRLHHRIQTILKPAIPIVGLGHAKVSIKNRCNAVFGLGIPIIRCTSSKAIRIRVDLDCEEY